jgi:peptidoglycan lytic transglycosylase
LTPPRRAAAAVLVLCAAACATQPPAAPPHAAPPSPAQPQAAPAAPGAGGFFEEGVASWYGGDDGFEGKPTASGEIYDSSKMTAAHRTLPLQSIVDVTSVDSGATARVRINDRGPFLKGRIIDLSREAARQVGILGPGTGRVRLTLVARGATPTPAPSTLPWVVQVGSFADAGRAQSQVERVRATGRAAFLEAYQGLTRVKVGPYPSRVDAEVVLRALEAAGFEGIVVPQPPGP